VTTRRAFLGVLAGGFLGTPRLAAAQQSSKVYRIGLLASTPAGDANPVRDALLARLRDLGYVEGRTMALEYRTSDGRNERYPALAEDLVKAGVDVIVAPGTSAAVAARRATTTIPIVMMVVADPVGAKLVASLARPGGNVTGMSSSATDLVPKHIELVKEAMPRVSRVAALWSPTSSADTTALEQLRAAAESRRVRIHAIEVRDPKELEGAFAAITQEGAEAVIPLDNASVYAMRRRILELAVQRRLPTFCFQRLYTEAGALMSYGPSFTDLARRTAGYVDRILKGARPSDLPVEQPTVFELVVNLKTAKAIRLTVPPALLARADEVIQ
jgi:putative ABC transport system substrate-binding protein